MLASQLVALPLASLSIRAADAVAEKPEPFRMVTYNIYSDWRAPEWGVPPRAAGVEKAIAKGGKPVLVSESVRRPSPEQLGGEWVGFMERRGGVVRKADGGFSIGGCGPVRTFRERVKFLTINQE